MSIKEINEVLLKKSNQLFNNFFRQPLLATFFLMPNPVFFGGKGGRGVFLKIVSNKIELIKCLL